MAFKSSFKYLSISSSKTFTLTEQAFRTSNASWSCNKANNKCSNVANSCFSEDALVIARRKVSSKDLDSIFIPSLIELAKDVHISAHNS